MVYKVIGLMSGSSLDGLDICYTFLEEMRGKWSFDIQEAECIHYEPRMAEQLSRAATLPGGDFLKLHTSYGRFLGEKVNEFVRQHGLDHKIDFIASHGHTVYHDPANHTSFQIGDGATIAAVTNRPVISDLRSLDVALGGQGAPIVPIGDKLLFSDFDYWLNIGGIINITVQHEGKHIAFDIGPGNQVLNALAAVEGKDMDENGELARQGSLLTDVLGKLNGQAYYKKLPPKSLSNDAAKALVFPTLMQSSQSNRDLLRTAAQHMAEQIGEVVKQYPSGKERAKMLVTGGGAFNKYLIELMEQVLEPLNVHPVVPYEQVVKYKEALVMALIGALRWREETNVLSDVTGASKDSISGALWMV